MKIKVALVSVLLVSSVSYALTDQELLDIRNGFEARRDSMLQSQAANPYPSIDENSTVQIYAWSKLDYAMAALFLNIEIEQANQAVIDAVNNTLNSGLVVSEFGTHWFGGHLCRIYEFFKDGSSYYPGRLSTAAKEAILSLMWEFAKGESKLSETETGTQRLWYIWGSENHEAMRDATCWAAAKMFTENPVYSNAVYDDGAKAGAHYAAWTAFHKAYLSERIRKGLLLEIGSNGYSPYTLQNWYNYYDFSDDPLLKKIAGYALDVWWTDWAQEQINGVRGGGKARVAHGSGSLLATSEAAYYMSWYYLGQGIAANKHPNVMCLATSSYRMPLVVMDIALDVAGKGTYETYSRRPGYGLWPAPADLPTGQSSFDPDCGRIVKYSYCTPEFVLGTLLFENKPESEWPNISDQNRWHGLIFSAAPSSRIVPQVQALSATNRNYNAHWAIQKKGTLITQKLANSSATGNMRVFFSKDLVTQDLAGWIFARTSNSNAFAAVKIVQGSYVWEDEENGWGKWAVLSQQYSPVIIEAARGSEYVGFEDFKDTVTFNNPSINNNIMTYSGLGGAGTFTFDISGGSSPLITGQAVNYCPDYVFKSPFINSEFGSDVVTITKDGREHVINLDFSGCEDILISDINSDCYVNFLDFSEMASRWLECSDPADDNCSDFIAETQL